MNDFCQYYSFSMFLDLENYGLGEAILFYCVVSLENTML